MGTRCDTRRQSGIPIPCARAQHPSALKYAARRRTEAVERSAFVMRLRKHTWVRIPPSAHAHVMLNNNQHDMIIQHAMMLAFAIVIVYTRCRIQRNYVHFVRTVALEELAHKAQRFVHSVVNSNITATASSRSGSPVNCPHAFISTVRYAATSLKPSARNASAAAGMNAIHLPAGYRSRSSTSTEIGRTTLPTTSACYAPTAMR